MGNLFSVNGAAITVGAHDLSHHLTEEREAAALVAEWFHETFSISKEFKTDHNDRHVSSGP